MIHWSKAAKKIRTVAVLGATALSMGCGIAITDDGCWDDTGNSDRVNNDRPYVDTWLNIPSSVVKVIAPAAKGYFSPSLSRYGEYLYPHNTPYDPYNLPCYVRADFNGDRYDDFAFLFSSEEWDNDNWYLTTKMIVVLSAPSGYEIGADMVLGTVTASDRVPIEEYWSIFWVSAGSHTFTTIKNGVRITKTVTMNYPSFYLASLDPDEEALFYADGDNVYEMSLDAGLAKKQMLSKSSDAQTQKRIIPFKKDIAGRERPVK